MDPICHTLAGGVLAETGLKRRTALGTLTLIAGANVPDIDVFVAGVGGVEALEFRRGWTHGVLAMAGLPVALAGVILLIDVAIRRRIRPEPSTGSGASGEGRQPARFLPLVALSAIAVASHYALDFLNTYGIRLLMPFSGRWFYGDALFIIDPWMWVMLAGGILGARWRSIRRRPRAARPARVALVLAGTYAIVMLGVGLAARHVVLRALEAEGLVPVRVMAAPVFADPFRREVVADMGSHYELGVLTWLPAPRFERTGERVAKNVEDPHVRAARHTAVARAFLTWSRFPFFVVETRAREVFVAVGDMRWYRRRLVGWPTVRVPVSGQPLGGRD